MASLVLSIVGFVMIPVGIVQAQPWVLAGAFVAACVGLWLFLSGILNQDVTVTIADRDDPDDHPDHPEGTDAEDSLPSGTYPMPGWQDRKRVGDIESFRDD